MARLAVYEALVCLCLCFAANFASAADGNWPRWRGPQQNGHSEDSLLPVRFTASDIAWKTPVPGIGQSSPIVWGDSIFLTAALDKGQERLVYGLDRKTGEILW